MQFDQLRYERESYAHAAVAPAAAGVGLTEHLKNMGHELWINSLSRILDNQDCLLFLALTTNRYGPSRRRKLNAVIKQIPDHLFQPQGISIDKENIVVVVRL